VKPEQLATLAPQRTNQAGAALLLPDGTAKTGMAEIQQQADPSRYVIRFIKEESR